MTQTCSHGLVERKKFGTRDLEGGLVLCLGCGLPTSESLSTLARQGVSTAPSTPVSRAKSARAAGQRLFEIQLDVSVSARDVEFASADSGSRSAVEHGGTLTAIEDEGWGLIHASYIFVETGQSSRAKMLGSGESVATSGVIVGIYLFRAVELAAGE